MRSLPILLCAVFVGCHDAPDRRPLAGRFPTEKVFARPLAVNAPALRAIPAPTSIDYRRAFGDTTALRVALEHSLDWLEDPTAARYFPYARCDGEPITREHARASLIRFRSLLLDDTLGEDGRLQALLSEFAFYEAAGASSVGDMLFTGYAEFSTTGSLVPSADHPYPLYRPPEGLTRPGTSRRFFDRWQIDREGAIEGQSLELVYLADPIDTYLIHLRGSARIVLHESGVLRVGWAADNGHAYGLGLSSLARQGWLNANRNLTSEMERHLREDPERLEDVQHRDRYYAFFRECSADGPSSNLGIPLTPRVSIATDKQVFPAGALALYSTLIPEFVNGEAVPQRVQSFAFDQDRGGVAGSAGRCDIFLGGNRDARRSASVFREEGRLYYLFLKRASVQSSP